MVRVPHLDVVQFGRVAMRIACSDRGFCAVGAHRGTVEPTRSDETATEDCVRSRRAMCGSTGRPGTASCSVKPGAAVAGCGDGLLCPRCALGLHWGAHVQLPGSHSTSYPGLRWLASPARGVTYDDPLGKLTAIVDIVELGMQWPPPGA